MIGYTARVGRGRGRGWAVLSIASVGVVGASGVGRASGGWVGDDDEDGRWWSPSRLVVTLSRQIDSTGHERHRR